MYLFKEIYNVIFGSNKSFSEFWVVRTKMRQNKKITILRLTHPLATASSASHSGFTVNLPVRFSPMLYSMVTHVLNKELQMVCQSI